MTKIAKAEFKTEFAAGITNDAATQQRLTAAGTNGKALLDSVDADRNGKIEGQELDALWKKIDDFDHDGNAGTVSNTLPVALVTALRKPGPVVTPSEGTLARGAKGDAVKALQQKLIELGYNLGDYGADGDFGGTTFKVVQQFQTDRRLPVTGSVDASTLAAIKSAAPVYPEYGEMYKDGVLQTTLGLGFDEDSNDLWVRREVLDGLQRRGFAKLTKDEMTAQGLDPNGVFYAKKHKHAGKDVTVLVRVVDRDSQDAKGQFAKGMKSDDLILYTGHGRRGSGPDFDRDSSPAGNFVIGPPSEEGHYALGANDLDKPNTLSNGYQMMVFDGCNTKWYADDFRSRPRNKSEGNLDLLLSNTELPWSTSADDILGALDGVLAGESMAGIKGRLDRINADSAKGTNTAFRADGFRGNTYNP